MRKRSSMTWQFEMLESALAASTTIALRSLGLASSYAAGKAPDARETTRMVAEKSQAFTDGMLAASLACHRLWWQAALSRSLAPADAWLKVARAGSKPGRVTVRRNARRLSRRVR